MRLREAAAGLCVLAAVAGLQAQTGGQAGAPPPNGAQNTSSPNVAEMSSHDAPATFSTKVNLVMVPVVVRDAKGKAIGTLQKDDFQLFDKGKPQVITRFSVEKAGETRIPTEVATDEVAIEKPAGTTATPAPIAEHFVIYLFDDVHTNNSDLMQARNAADKQLAESFDPATRAAIFTTSGQGNVDFTDDRAKLHDALMKLMARPTMGPRGDDCPDIGLYQADLIQNKNDPSALQAAVQEVLATCAPPPPGPPSPASQAQALQIAESLSRSTASRLLDFGERDTRLAFTTLEAAIRRLAAAPGDRTLILTSSGFYITDDLQTDESNVMDRAIRANVRINTLNAHGLYVLIPGGDASTKTAVPTPAIGNMKDQFDHQGALAEEDVLAEFAYATGGRYFHNNNDLKSGFQEVAATPEYLYVLGFSPQNLKFDGSYHPLKVSLKMSRGMDLQARRGYYAPRHLPDPEEDAKREIQEAMFSRDELQDIPVDLHMQFFKSSDVAAKIAILARVSVKNLRFRKADGRNNDNLTIISGVFDRNGNYITGMEKVVQMHLLDSTLEKVSNAGITVRSNFDVAPGSYVIRLIVRDSEGQAMAARNGVVEIP